MADESRNLTLRRAPMNIWNRPGWTPGTAAWDRERLLMGAWGAGVAALGFSRQGWLGKLIGVAGAGMVARAAQGHHDLTRARAWMDRTLRSRGWRRTDEVEHASEESFPASDVPSWTPTSGARTER